MRKFTRRAAVAATALVATVGFTATTASATSAVTFTASPGGPFTATAQNPTLSVPAATLQCDTSAAAGSIKSGSGLSGTGIADINSLDFQGCTFLGIDFEVDLGGLPWKLNAESEDASGRVTGSITGITAKISDPTGSCSADFAGPEGASSTATVTGYFDNGSGDLVINDGDLTAYNADCLGLINDGDNATFDASYPVTPTQSIHQD